MRAVSSCALLGWAATGGVKAFVPSVAPRSSLATCSSLQQHFVGALQARPAAKQRINRPGRGGLSMLTSSPRQPGGNGDDRVGPDEQSSRAVKNMLSEAAVASVVYYWLEFRDDLTPQWLKQFTRAMGEIQDIGWQKHMGLLMRQEPEEILVRRMAQRPLGGSGNNPFLKPNRTAKEYTVLIEPQAIAKKIMQIREQISREWIRDLELVSAENTELERHREDAVCRDKESAERDRKMVFDHDPLNNTSSPYRGKNYKLLLETITKAALRSYRSELRISGDRYTLNWVEKFMHRNDHEDGPNLQGNELMEAILDGPILLIKDPRTEKNRVIDPGHIGRQLMAFRSLEAQRVIEALSSVNADHSALNRQFLEERLQDQVQDVVLSQRRRRILEASAPENDFPTRDSVENDGTFETFGITLTNVRIQDRQASR